VLHFNKKTEYALLAIEHMIQKEGQALPVTSTREISNSCHIPYPLLAKVMQRLASHGVIRAFQGTKGGYVLAKRPGDITVANIVEIFDGPFAVAECFNGEKITCPQWDGCLIKGPFYELNYKIYNLLAQTTVADLAIQSHKPAVQEQL